MLHNYGTYNLYKIIDNKIYNKELMDLIDNTYKNQYNTSLLLKRINKSFLFFFLLNIISNMKVIILFSIESSSLSEQIGVTILISMFYLKFIELIFEITDLLDYINLSLQFLINSDCNSRINFNQFKIYKDYFSMDYYSIYLKSDVIKIKKIFHIIIGIVSLICIYSSLVIFLYVILILLYLLK
jgi:hypothetical protein